ncbi:hypothetical protein MNEG_14098 [Monoraphidium neglectum]|uniref:Thioesterase domain-containing protein n=1 Tax=Monoraphidium neglectum TaxID=145388 RepID=A0A0D2J1E3_9CHLO|nr:hypothetical protein MNEG_14098 [Monoraphidium neglectum]KIY93862.1 hypothetical protein MNEG_14098 [Monoraphidium neglectum]|eukprot:XP_013892882.1 hypothetical protein MNEG_14098 [Monoraphidium neglectum]
MPGLTARLELDYKRRIAAPAVLHVATEVESVEPRKVWMRATVRDGDGVTYATGRALFVAPNIMKQLGLAARREDAARQAGAPVALA